MLTEHVDMLPEDLINKLIIIDWKQKETIREQLNESNTESSTRMERKMYLHAMKS
jgi:hypothetical protein